MAPLGFYLILVIKSYTILRPFAANIPSYEAATPDAVPPRLPPPTFFLTPPLFFARPPAVLSFAFFFPFEGLSSLSSSSSSVSSPTYSAMSIF